MREKTKKIVLNAIGIIFIVLGIAAILNTFYEGRYASVIWLCYIYLIIVGIGVLRKDSFLITSQLNIMTIPILIWTIDFLYVLITKQSLFGITNYFFIPGPVLGKIVTSQHLFSIPLSFYALYLIKLKRKDAWKVSFIQIILTFFITILFTSREVNINCVYKPCMNLTIPYYQVVWFLVLFLMIITTNFAISKAGFLNEKRRR